MPRGNLVALMLLLVALTFTLIEAIFTAFEVSLGAVSRARFRVLALEARGEWSDARGVEAPTAGATKTADRAARVLTILERPDRLSLLFITVTSLALWTAVSLLTREAFHAGWPAWSLPLAVLFVLFVAEVLPLLIAARHAEAIALGAAPFLSGALVVCAPVLLLVGGAAFGIARALGVGEAISPEVKQGELRTALAAAEEEGVIERDERALLEGAMDFQDKVVREVMTPRIDIIGVPADADLMTTLRLALREGHSRLPVFEGTLDRITGVVAAKDLLPHLKSGHECTHRAADVARPVFFVPENKHIDAALDELRRERTLLAVVVDSDGGTAGLVTLEDLLEELVGEIQDEYDSEEPALRLLSDEAEGAHLVGCEAGTSLREVTRFCARELHLAVHFVMEDEEPADPSQSLAGLALELFDSVPKPGMRVLAGQAEGHASGDDRETYRVELRVVAMDGPRIETVALRFAPAAEGS